MRHALPAIAAALGLLASSAAFAQSVPSNPMSPGGGTPEKPTSPAPAAVSSASNPRTEAAPVSGANSFTEGQARDRMEHSGVSNITGLKEDSQGVWRGQGMKDGKSVTVALDYQGNVVSQ